MRPTSQPGPAPREGESPLDAITREPGPLVATMGIEFTHLDTERAVATMPVEGNTQPYGLLHGGASALLAETVGSALCMAIAGPERAAVGMSITATHHRPVMRGFVTATAEPVAVGRTTATTLIRITDEDERAVCTATLLCTFIKNTPGRQG